LNFKNYPLIDEELIKKNKEMVDKIEESTTKLALN